MNCINGHRNDRWSLSLLFNVWIFFFFNWIQIFGMRYCVVVNIVLVISVLLFAAFNNVCKDAICNYFLLICIHKLRKNLETVRLCAWINKNSSTLPSFFIFSLLDAIIFCKGFCRVDVLNCSYASAIQFTSLFIWISFRRSIIHYSSRFSIRFQ